MKSQIVPALLCCIIFPCLASFFHYRENCLESKREAKEELIRKTDPLPGTSDEPCIQPVTYGELSTKQINYLIP